MRKVITLGIAAILLCGCFFMRAPSTWAFKSELKSVPESEPHGVLVLVRNNPNIWVLVDNRMVFKDAKTTQLSFRLAPGKHKIQTMYHGHESYGAKLYSRSSDTLEKLVELKEGSAIVVNIVTDGWRMGIQISEGWSVAKE